MKRGFWILGLLIILVSGCIEITQYSTNEEICSAIKTDWLRDQCFSYIHEDKSLCEFYGCYQLAFKLNDSSICTNQPQDKPYCEKLASLSSGEKQKLIEDYNKFFSSCEVGLGEEDIPCGTNPKEICDLDKKDCYGGCLVKRHNCIIKTALISNNINNCDYISDRRDIGQRNKCYALMAMKNKNVVFCNKIQKGYGRDECYINIATDSTQSMLDYNRIRHIIK